MKKIYYKIGVDIIGQPIYVVHFVTKIERSHYEKVLS